VVKIEQNNASIRLWDPVNGKSWIHSDKDCPLNNIGCLVGPEVRIFVAIYAWPRSQSQYIFVPIA